MNIIGIIQATRIGNSVTMTFRSVPISVYIKRISCVLLLCWGIAQIGTAAQTPAPQQVLVLSAERGTEVIKELKGRTFYADLLIETVSQADVITGSYRRSSRVYYNPSGEREEIILEEITKLPKELVVTPNFANNMIRVYTFIITPEALKQYEFSFVGREQVDELNTLVFDVNPKVKLPDPNKSTERFLRGRIWIDDQDYQVVKIEGEALPEHRAHRTPKFETYFQNYGKYWFPVQTTADDDVLMGRRITRVIVKVKYSGYRKADVNGSPAKQN
jgi:hypothetical protein